MLRPFRRLSVRQTSPRLECLAALTEEPENNISSHQFEHYKAASSDVDEVGSKGSVLKNIDSTGAPVTPACTSGVTGESDLKSKTDVKVFNSLLRQITCLTGPLSYRGRNSENT